MPYTALYRKWRPSRFAEVRGQEHIVTTLTNQIMTDHVGHAYLFCGSRGTGKTTVAKILAKAVNCEDPADGEPCGHCAMCRAIDSGSAMNVFEMDAASNNGVDNVRELLEDIQYPPAEGRYRVYIVDEVHMFSTSAFNAFLKTLEEPPAYVIFILATTEPQKIPATILSRCQQYDFHRIGPAVIRDRLKELCDYEGIEADERAIDYIARKADGGMRDAISLLDQAAAASVGQVLTYDLALKVLGAVDSEIFSRYLRLSAERDIADLLMLIDEIVMSGRDLSRFVQDYIWYLRNLLLIRTAPDGAGVVDAGTEDMKRLKEEAQMIGTHEIMGLIRMYSELFNQMRQTADRRTLLEVAAIRGSVPEADHSMDAVLSRLETLERELRERPVITAPAPAREPQAPAGGQPEERMPAQAPARQEQANREQPVQPVREQPVRPVQSAQPEPARRGTAPADIQGLIKATDRLCQIFLREAVYEMTGPAEMTVRFRDAAALESATKIRALDQLKSAWEIREGSPVKIISLVDRKKPAAENAQADTDDFQLPFVGIEIEEHL